MTSPEESLILPTAIIRVTNAADALPEIRAGLEALAAEGKRAWAEVHYPAPAHLDEVEAAAWLERQRLDTFDAVELLDGEVVPLPPYEELRQGGRA